jgi:putative dimethyl sulfoxide reductase chaperone
MSNEQELIAAFRRAVADDLTMLAVLLDKELSAEILQELIKIDFPNNIGLKLQNEHSLYAVELVSKAIATFPAELDAAFMDSLAADYAAIFLNGSLKTSPYESVWLSEEGITHQDAMFETRDWYAKFDLAAENWRIRADDHLILQINFISHLMLLDEDNNTLTETARFMDEHILRWVSKFAGLIVDRCSTPLYAGLAWLTAQYLEELRDMLATILEQPRPTAAEIEQRMNATKSAKPQEFPVKFMPGYEPH